MDWSGIEGECEPAEFEWYLTHNFYTQNGIRMMLADISETASQLEKAGVFSLSSEITENYRAWLIDEDIQQKMGLEGGLQFIDAHLSVVVDLYRRFVFRMERMLDENSEWPLISIMGP